jgi:glutamate synthase (NADPH) large chain
MRTDSVNHFGLYRQEFEHDSCGVGIVADIKGRSSHEIVRRGIEVLERMEHRGAESSDNKTGDGAGIMLQIPHTYYADIIPDLPKKGLYATGIVFLPSDETAIFEQIAKLMENCAIRFGLRIFLWRDVPVDISIPGPIASQSIPCIKQLFVEQEVAVGSFPILLFTFRKVLEKLVRESTIEHKERFHILSLSEKTIVFKGMLMSHQLRLFYPELEDPRVESSVSLVHSRFSTNTFPSWELAQPFRMIAHNGEINTVSGNRNWMIAQEALLKSDSITDLEEIFPIIEPGKSDSASFDNVLELLTLAGRPLPQALMMMIPESFNEKNPIPEDLRSFYTYSACVMEPWDGPASMVFFDGRYIGGTLDRNGLRPSRYVITKDHLLVMASEVGVQDFNPAEIVTKGRLMPGKLLLVDLQQGRIIPDEEVKNSICSHNPYTKWISEELVFLRDLPRITGPEAPPISLGDSLVGMERTFGYTAEDRENLLKVMAQSAQEPTSSMGTDTPIAILSQKPQRIFAYFKQVFAQVTNPPMDSIREELVMSLTSFCGRHENLLSDHADHCHRLRVFNPIISNEDLARIQKLNDPAFRILTIDATFEAESPSYDTALQTSLEKALDRMIREIIEGIDQGFTFFVLSDRSAINPADGRCPIPSLIAMGAAHHGLINARKRLQAVLISDSGEPREVMHYALLFGFGADLILPYGTYAVLADLVEKDNELQGKTFIAAEQNYQKGIGKALLKIMAKMGISTLRSYRGAQIFEAIGLGPQVMDKCFKGCQSRIGGIGFKEIELEALSYHRDALLNQDALLPTLGQYKWRKKGEEHAWNPETIRLLQWAVRESDYGKFKEFSRASDTLNRTPHVLRGLFEFSDSALSHPISINEVEPVEVILKRFATGAMSFGSISKEAHEVIARAMNAIKCRSNSGEGGEDPERFVTRADGSSSRGAIKQVASGRFGVTSNYLANADEIQIKISQGAKPGEGGQLPGHKTDAVIAKTRHATQGVTLISPPPHHDIYSIEDLSELIYDLKSANPYARIGVKLVSETGVGTVAAGVAKAHADSILISGYDGGTGASPLSSIRYAGLPWEIGLSETHQTLVKNNLRGRVRLMTDGQLKTGRDIVIAAMLGAEEFGFGTSVLIVLGCVMMRKCHVNTCPMGIATQDPNLRKRFMGKEQHLINFFRFLAMETREVLASLGMKSMEELIGRSDLLKQRKVNAFKVSTIDLQDMLHTYYQEGVARHSLETPIERTETPLNQRLISRSLLALKNKVPVSFALPIKNTDRAVGATLSFEVSKRYDEDGLPENFVTVDFTGTAGQSFGAFLARGITFRLYGDANDYLGKGLSGGRIVVTPPSGTLFHSHENIIVGNTVLYGATQGELFVAGLSGERFCVRNSGADAVVEGTGDHCAEYMTGGTLVVLGDVGRNFAAGMSGGIAYVMDRKGDLEYKLNKGMVELSHLDNEEDDQIVKNLIRRHVYWTGSTYANEILTNWQTHRQLFVKVLPVEYKRALQQMKLAELDRKLNEIRFQEDIAARA